MVSPETKMVHDITETLKYYDLKDLNKNSASPSSESDLKKYLQSYENGYNIRTYEVNEEVIRKKFLVSKEDKDADPDDFNVLLLNHGEKNIDLIQLMEKFNFIELQHGKSYDYYSFDLKTLTDFLILCGAEKIILFDFTCNSFFTDVSPRTGRRLNLANVLRNSVKPVRLLKTRKRTEKAMKKREKRKRTPLNQIFDIFRFGATPTTRKRKRVA